MQFLNLTPHAVTIDGVGTLQPCGIIPRVGTVRNPVASVAGVRVIAQSMGEVVGLPEQVEGVCLIVSGMALEAVKSAGGRSDVFAPDTGADAIRNQMGHIVAVRGLVC